jgi:citrate lyase subunit beta/citryl-CoA lyase
MSERDELHSRIACARTLLFVPANRPERFEKALTSGADLVILDLEDSVPEDVKALARSNIESMWPRVSTFAVPMAIRINAIGSEEGERDLAWLAALNPAAALMVPKTDSAAALKRVHKCFQNPLILPMIESAAGYAAVTSIAQMRGVVRLVIGHVDFMADVGFQCGEAQEELMPLRYAVAIASRLSELASAVDGVTVEVGDEQRLRDDVGRALRFGFGGKLCIHPRQVDIVHQAMLPTAQDLDWARKVMTASDAANGAAVQVDGRMIDLPVVLLARQTLARAGRH